MNDILRTLIEPRKAVERYLDAILTDLLANMGAQQWRLRESACSALSDALQGCSLAQVDKYLEAVRSRSLCQVIRVFILLNSFTHSAICDLIIKSIE